MTTALSIIIDECNAPVQVVRKSTDNSVSAESDNRKTLLAAVRSDKTDGAMIALVPSETDLDRLTLAGDYEPREDLHLTLWFLGDAEDMTEDDFNTVVSRVREAADGKTPVRANAFGVAHWNPSSDYPAWVLNVGDERSAETGNSVRALENVRDDILDHVGDAFMSPKQYNPWQPHITLAYSDADLHAQLMQKLGPVTFDRVRVAWGDQVADVPLGDVLIADAFHLSGKHDQRSHGNRAGKSTNVPGKTSKYAPIIESINSQNASAPTADASTAQNAADNFDDRVRNAVSGAAVLDAVTYADRDSLLDAYAAERGDTGDAPTRDAVDRSIKNYQGTSYLSINGELRASDVTPPIRKHIDNIDAVMRISATTDDVVVYRGVSDPQLTFGPAWNTDGDNSGLEWRDEGYTSTTGDEKISKKFLKGYSGGPGVQMRLLVPRNTPAIVPDVANPQLRKNETELLLARGRRFRVVRDETRDGQRSLDVEVIND